MENKKKKKLILIIVIASILIIASVICIFLYIRNENNVTDIGNDSNSGEVIEQPNVDEKPKEEDGRNLQNETKSLNATYTDVVGWLVIPGTNIDTPVFQSSNNNRYLRHDRDNKYYMWGEEFLDYRCNINNMDNMSHFIIYGHNSEDEGNFTPLLNYKNQEFFNQNNIIEFSTLNGNYKWQIFSVYVTDINFFYIDTIFADVEEYSEFLRTLKSKSMYDTGVEISGNDTILTLSTCDYTRKDGRFVVQAKLINE